MKKVVKSFQDMPLLGKTLDDLANEISEGRADAVAGVLKMARAYAEGYRRFSNAETFFRNDPRTRWISKTTHDLLLMVDSRDLDPRVVLIPEQKLAGFVKELPFEEQQRLLDQNPYITVVDKATGKPRNIGYIDVTPRQTDIVWDRKNKRFRTVAEQRSYLSEEVQEAKKKSESYKPYIVRGNIVIFNKACTLGRNQVIELCRTMGIRVNG